MFKMKWKPIEQATHAIGLPEGYLFKQLTKEKIPEIIERLKQWYPDILVFSESCHLDPRFYSEQTFLFGDADEKNIFPAMCLFDSKIVGFMSFEKNSLGRTVSARMATFDPAHRGKNLGAFVIQIIEEMGKLAGAELVYSYATLKIPHQQRHAERMGYKLVGIIPAYDRDMIEPGVVKRVYEGLYAKVLVDSESIQLPDTAAMTPNTLAMWNFLYGEQ
jgi:hypothetical protein